MTYRELIEICYKTPAKECWECAYKNECKAFVNKTDGEMPVALHNIFNINIDAEIEVEE